MFGALSPLQVMSLIAEERKKQDAKWGEQNHRDPVWVTILTEEVGEVAQAVLEEPTKQLVEELIQVSAVCVAWIEAIGRRAQ